MRTQSGFTLIELVITMGIVGLLLATGVPAFRTYGRQVEFDNQAALIASAVSRARTLSLAPEASKQSDVTAYGVSFDIATNTVQVGRFTTATPPVQLSTVSTSNLSPLVAMQSVPSGPVLFPIHLQGEPVFTSGAAQQVVVEHKQLRERATRTLTIHSTTGQVSVE